MGFSQRFIVKFIEGDISDDNGRDIIKEKLLAELQENPFKFRGLYADREITIGLADEQNYAFYLHGTYAHNIWLELAVDFGIILGTILFLIIVVKAIKLLTTSSLALNYLPALAICCGLVCLLMSSSFLENKMFFFMLGLMCNSHFVMQKKNIRNSKQ